MMDETGGRALYAHRLEQRVGDQRFGHAFADCVADELASVQILDTRQVQPALDGGDVGDICHPHFVRPSCHKALCQQIRRDRQAVIGMRRRLEPAPLDTAQPQLAAQPFDAAHAGAVAVGLQLLLQPLRPVASPTSTTVAPLRESSASHLTPASLPARDTLWCNSVSVVFPSHTSDLHYIKVEGVHFFDPRSSCSRTTANWISVSSNWSMKYRPGIAAATPRSGSPPSPVWGC